MKAVVPGDSFALTTSLTPRLQSTQSTRLVASVLNFDHIFFITLSSRSSLVLLCWLVGLSTERVEPPALLKGCASRLFVESQRPSGKHGEVSSRGDRDDGANAEVAEQLRVDQVWLAELDRPAVAAAGGCFTSKTPANVVTPCVQPTVGRERAAVERRRRKRSTPHAAKLQGRDTRCHNNTVLGRIKCESCSVSRHLNIANACMLAYLGAPRSSACQARAAQRQRGNVSAIITDIRAPHRSVSATRRTWP